MIEVAILIAVHFLSCYYWYQAGKDKGRITYGFRTRLYR